MSGTTSTPEAIFVSVKQAADMLALSPWSTYQLLDSGAIESRYHGRRRLVSVKSLKQYAANLPTYPTEGGAA